MTGAWDGVSLEGRSALVTGAGARDGSGFATARLLAARGARVALASTTDRIEERAAQITAEGGEAVGLVGDLRDEEQAGALVAEAEAAFGPAAILVNNAGMVQVGEEAAEPAFLEMTPAPKHLQPALIGRVKIMAHMNIAERYVPQDGHITLRFEGRKVDIRVSTVPTVYGESIVMRILDKSSLPLDLVSLGMREQMRGIMDKMIQKPHGMVLVTGPTGSGKTTTLYACLNKLYDPRKKIITIEDPVEYELTGINQIPVNPKRGLTFATGLRAILRQDPDVIFVGEVRDNETVDIAIRSALTGHLLFSTLHTNDSISSVGRLVDMGAEPFLIASVLEGLLAQRLGRRLCRECTVRVPMTEEVAVRITPEERALFTEGIAVGKGCEKCNGSGFRGRMGFYEIARINARLREGISKNRTTLDLRGLVDADFTTMRDDGMAKAAAGLTTVDEVLRATQDIDDG